MNLVQLIDTFRRCLPGWDLPPDMGIDHRANCEYAVYLAFGMGNKFFIPDPHAAAIICESVLDHFDKEEIYCSMQREYGGVWYVEVGNGNVADSKHRLEALAAAVEAMRKDEAP